MTTTETRYIISGKSGEWRKHESRYEYKEFHTKNNTRCPVCGGLGIPWRGWFSCEDPKCDAIALVKTGVVFVRIVK